MFDPASTPSQSPAATRMGTNVAAGTAHQLVMVSRLQIYNNATSAYLPSFITWTLNFPGSHIIPEPATLLLLGSGVLGLALYGRRKMKR